MIHPVTYKHTAYTSFIHIVCALVRKGLNLYCYTRTLNSYIYIRKANFLQALLIVRHEEGGYLHCASVL